MYEPMDSIDFSLFVPDYMEMFEIFNQNAQAPFNKDPECAKVDLKKFMELGNAPDKPKRYTNTNKTEVTRKIVRYGEDDEDADPDWIEFDPEKVKGKFIGHVMDDEEALRNRVI